MLVLTRKLNQSIIVNDNIKVKVLEISDNCIKIGIDAPKDVSIHREEVYEEIQKENQRASETPDEINLDAILKRKAS